MGCSLSASVVPALRKKREEQGTHCIDGASEIKACATRQTNDPMTDITIQ
jgi:hypothetical protein